MIIQLNSVELSGVDQKNGQAYEMSELWQLVRKRILPFDMTIFRAWRVGRWREVGWSDW